MTTWLLWFLPYVMVASFAVLVGYVVGSYDRSELVKLTRQKLATARLDAQDWRHTAERAELARAEAEARLEMFRMGAE